MERIIQSIQDMAGKFGVYQIFDDWVKIMALSFANQVRYKDDMEKEYLRIINRFSENERKRLTEMIVWLFEYANEKKFDVLGHICMNLELGAKKNAQYFTPYNICQLLARTQTIGEKPVLLYEPTCGSGGNVIAYAEEMERRNIDYRKKLKAVCMDIDIRAVYMTYVQLTIYGIPGMCYQCNTLEDPEGKESSTGRLYTIGYMLNKWGIKNGSQTRTEDQH